MRIETERLILRPWTDADRASYCAFCADPEVRRYYPSVLTTEETEAMIDRMIAGLARDGFGFLVVERKSDGAMLGDVGLSPVPMPLRGNPKIEIGWLLGRRYWGNGYAPEAASACLSYAWDVLDADEVVAFTSIPNGPSQRVMEKIGMVRDLQGDFEHPKIAEGHPLRPHILYRIANPTRS